MDDLAPEAILGIAAGCVAGVVGLGVLIVWFTCPRVFAATFGTRVPKPVFKRREKAIRSDTLEISQNPMVVFPKPRAHALPLSVDIDSVLAVQRLKREFKSVPIRT